jgi:hypothetical protein
LEFSIMIFVSEELLRNGISPIPIVFSYFLFCHRKRAPFL